MILVLALLSFFSAHAFHQVEAHLNHQSILVRLDPGHDFIKGDRVVVLTSSKQALSAIGIVKSVNKEEFPPTAKVEIKELIGRQLVLVGDPVERLTEEVLEQYHVSGHISLLLGKDDEISSRFKELPYLGVFNSDGHTLAKNEWLVSIPQVQYGIGENFTVKVLTGLYLDGFANIGGKYKLMETQWGHLTFNGLVSRQVDLSDWAVLSGLVLTLPSNEKFQSHLVINVRVEGIEEDNPEVDKLNLFPASDIRTIYEYVTDDWDRWLFGPLFNFETQTVGGTLSHMWIWDTFHLNLGFATSDVSEVEFREDGYYLVFDFFWRF